MEGPKPVSQKEYLKRYLFKDEKKKKKKKPKISSSSIVKRSVIIDEDDELGLKKASIDDDEYNFEFLGEDAPQVAGIIDERAHDRDNPLFWKGIGSGETQNGKGKSKDLVGSDSSKKKKQRSPSRSSSDISPPRRKDDTRKESLSSKKSSHEYKIRSSSPTRKSRREQKSSRQSDSDSSDLSPPRKHKSTSDKGFRGKVTESSQRSDSDISPPRKSEKRRKESNTDTSRNAKQSKQLDSDVSPPRKSRNCEKNKKRSDADFSPLRKPKEHNYDSDLSPPRKSRKHNNGSNLSLPRKSKTGDIDSDLSPPRKTEKSSRHSKDLKTSHNSDSDLSPPRKSRKSHDPSSSKRHDKRKDSPLRTKMDKTLDGKRAGLQKADRLREELEAIKANEEKMFRQMSGSMTGRGAEPILRDRKTGRIRDLQKEKEEKAERAKKEAERNEKYSRWGRGLAQVEETEQRVADAIREMSKPLARYKDDVDLDKMLREREREGDPMLEYIKKKQTEALPTDVPNKPSYLGAWMPNRFAVPPGHRWDGVDRSNGYEKRWFEAQNAKQAVDEEAYKWSIEDM